MKKVLKIFFLTFNNINKYFTKEKLKKKLYYCQNFIQNS